MSRNRMEAGWSEPDVEIALLLRLLDRGECRHSNRAAPVLSRWRLARWIEPATRADTWLLRKSATAAVQGRLDVLLPTWKADIDLLQRHQLDPTDPRNLRSLPALRAEPTAHGFLHRKVWNAATAAGSKVPSRLASPAVLTDDWAVRGRCECATILSTPEGDVDLAAQTRLLSEFCIPERGWRRTKRLTGVLPTLIITIENVGPLVDLALPPNAMLLFSQGTAIGGAGEILKALPQARWLHFGDLDSPGLAAAARLAKFAGRPLTAYIPSFASEYMDRSLPVRKRWRSVQLDHPILFELAAVGRWLEQESFMLDTRLASDLADAVMRLD